MLSSQAERYLKGLTRSPYVDDVGLVREHLEKHQVPVTDALLNFHHTFAGYPHWVGDSYVGGYLYGLIHLEPKWLSPLELYVDNEGDQQLLMCVDKPLDMNGCFWYLNPAGVFFEEFCPYVSSIFMMFEQEAHIYEFIQEHNARQIPLSIWNDRSELLEVLLPRLESRIIDSLSDDFSTTYSTNQMIIIFRSERKQFQVFVADGTTPQELADFRLDRTRTVSELQSDFCSTYPGRRSIACQELLRTRCAGEPEVARMLLSFVLDASNDYSSRMGAMQNLGQWGNPSIIPILETLLGDNQKDCDTFPTIGQHAQRAIDQIKSRTTK